MRSSRKSVPSLATAHCTKSLLASYLGSSSSGCSSSSKDFIWRIAPCPVRPTCERGFSFVGILRKCRKAGNYSPAVRVGLRYLSTLGRTARSAASGCRGLPCELDFWSPVSGMRSCRLRLLAIALCLPLYARAQAPSPSEALALEQQGNLEPAARDWQAVTERNPPGPGAFAGRGVALAKEQKYQQAASAYRKALALNPKLPGIHLNLGLAEFKLGHFEAAITPLRAALAADPNNKQARALLGLSYYGAKRFVDASKHLEIAA